MKYLILLGLFISVFSKTLNAQNYQDMPIAVQSKMDSNKVDGIDIYSGIQCHFQIELVNLQATEKVGLLTLLESDSKIMTFSIDNNNSTLTATTNGNYTIKDFKAHVKTTAASIQNYTATYDVSE